MPDMPPIPVETNLPDSADGSPIKFSISDETTNHSGIGVLKIRSLRGGKKSVQISIKQEFGSPYPSTRYAILDLNQAKTDLIKPLSDGGGGYEAYET